MKYKRNENITKADVRVHVFVCKRGLRSAHDFNNFAFFESLRLWHDSNRPYFNLYPFIASCLAKTPMDLDPAQITEGVIHRLGRGSDSTRRKVEVATVLRWCRGV